jgi:hypothetical protein
MKHRFFLLLLLFCWQLDARSSFAKNPHWESVFLPINDTIIPISLVFADSLHGYFYAVRPETRLGAHRSDGIPLLFATTDGGKKWTNRNAEQIFKTELTLDTNIGGGAHFASYPYITLPTSNSITLPNYFVSYKDLGFYTSLDNGLSWSFARSNPAIMRLGNEEAKYLGAIDTKTHLILHIDTGSKVEFWISRDMGMTFVDKRSPDSILVNGLRDRSGNTGVEFAPNHFSFSKHDDLHWIITTSDSDNFISQLGKAFDITRPFKITSLLTSDGGRHWEKYQNTLAHFPSIYGYLLDTKYLRNTSYVYMTTSGSEGYLWFGGGRDSIFNFASASQSIDSRSPDAKYYWANYVFSSDSGKTWIEDTSYAPRRRGFEPAAPGDVWCTITKADTLKNDAMMATEIIHTTDFGASWSIDSTSLFVPDFGPFDGRIVTFSDPRHGWIYGRSKDYKTSVIFRYVEDDNAFAPYIPTFNETYRTYLQLYPDPATSSITFKTVVIYPIENVEISDMLGRRYTCPFKTNQELKTAEVDVRGLSAGCYVGRITCGPMMLSLPFLVQRH